MAPLYFKHAVDAMTLAVGPAVLGALLLSGLARVVNGIAKEVQHPIFTPISQAAGRRVAYHTFAHVLDLDISYHLERRTGALSRILERGMQFSTNKFVVLACDCVSNNHGLRWCVMRRHSECGNDFSGCCVHVFAHCLGASAGICCVGSQIQCTCGVARHDHFFRLRMLDDLHDGGKLLGGSSCCVVVVQHSNATSLHGLVVALLHFGPFPGCHGSSQGSQQVG
jgi:hypothetical protein